MAISYVVPYLCHPRLCSPELCRPCLEQTNGLFLYRLLCFCLHLRAFRVRLGSDFGAPSFFFRQGAKRGVRSAYIQLTRTAQWLVLFRDHMSQHNTCQAGMPLKNDSSCVRKHCSWWKTLPFIMTHTLEVVRSIFQSLAVCLRPVWDSEARVLSRPRLSVGLVTKARRARHLWHQPNCRHEETFPWSGISRESAEEPFVLLRVLPGPTLGCACPR